MNKRNIILISCVSLLIIGLFFIGINTNNEIVEPVIIENEPIDYADYDFSKLSGDNYLKYEDDKYTSMFGIDVSAHQGTIDWAKVKNAGVEFVFIRLGYRGATLGLLNTDLEFENNYKGAIDNNIKVGVYFYSQAITRQEARNEAVYVYRVLKNRHLDFPVVFDYEETIFYDGTISRMADTSALLRTRIAEAFIDEMKNHGYETMIYTNKDWIINYYDNSLLTSNDIWYARYSTLEPEILVPFKIWQYCEDAYIDGIDTNVDLNIMFIQKNDLCE